MDDESFFLAQIPSPKTTRVRPKKISSLLSKVLTKYGVESQQAAQSLCQKWNETVGPEIAESTRVGNIHRGSLFVAIDNNLVAQELHMRKREILKALKQDPAFAEIKDLKFRIGT